MEVWPKENVLERRDVFLHEASLANQNKATYVSTPPPDFDSVQASSSLHLTFPLVSLFIQSFSAQMLMQLATMMALARQAVAIEITMARFGVNGTLAAGFNSPPDYGFYIF